MFDSYNALCSDCYVNQKLNLKLDLPKDRQVVLDLFDRVRRQFPEMTAFRRLKEEIALETGPEAEQHQWVAVRQSSIRTGVVNPGPTDAAHKLHTHILEVAPYFLSISPLDVDYLELLFGFDLVAGRNHDEVVAEALVAGTPLAPLLDLPGASVVDCQPVVGVVVRNGLGEECEGLASRDVEVTYEVKTRPGARQAGREEPISIYLTLRHYGPITDIKQLQPIMAGLSAMGERLIENRVLPGLLMPIREALGPGGGHG